MWLINLLLYWHTGSSYTALHHYGNSCVTRNRTVLPPARLRWHSCQPQLKLVMLGGHENCSRHIPHNSVGHIAGNYQRTIEMFGVLKMVWKAFIYRCSVSEVVSYELHFKLSNAVFHLAPPVGGLLVIMIIVNQFLTHTLSKRDRIWGVGLKEVSWLIECRYGSVKLTVSNQLIWRWRSKVGRCESFGRTTHGIEIEESWHNQAGTLLKYPYRFSSARKVDMSECPPEYGRTQIPWAEECLLKIRF